MCWSCDHPGGDYLAEVVRPVIARHGWFVQYVEPGGPHAALAYTVGLVEHGLPELVVRACHRSRPRACSTGSATCSTAA